MPPNRKQRREMSRYGLGQQMMEEAAAKLIRNTRTASYRLAFGGMMLALHEEFGFDKDKLDKLAVGTVKRMMNALSPTELRDELYLKTKFDVDEPIEEDRLGIEV